MTFVPPKEDSCVCAVLEKMGALTKDEVARLRDHKGRSGWVGHTSELALRMGLVTEEQLAKAISYNQRMARGEAVEVMLEIANDSAEVTLEQIAGRSTSRAYGDGMPRT